MEHRTKWHEAAIADLENTSLSYSAIGKKYGRSRDTIIKLSRLYNVTRKNPVSKNGQTKASEMRSLSEEHRALGSRLTVFRANQTYSQIAEKLGVSRHVVKMMELGAHDVTLSQLIRIADVLGQNLYQMITPIQIINKRKPPDIVGGGQ